VRPSELLDAKLDLIARLRDPVMRLQIENHLALDWTQSGERGQLGQVGSERGRQTAQALFHCAQAGLSEAAAYQVTEDLSLLLQAAAAGLDETDRMSREIAPTRAGLVRFERPLPIRDIRGKTLLVSWLFWYPVLVVRGRHDKGEPTPGLGYMMFNDRWTDPDDIERETAAVLAGDASPEHPLVKDPDTGEWRPDPEWSAFLATAGLRIGVEASGRWACMGAELVLDGYKLGPPTMPPDQETRDKLTADDVVAEAYTNSFRYLHALWLMLGQEIVQASPAELDRAARRRAERAKIPPRVTVIQLRRVAYRGEAHPEGSLVDWQHRWIVRGFWRWQVCGPNHPLAQEVAPGKWRARIWIAPFVKGPVDKPLVVTEKIYRLAR
jgi:hypothetical protein